MVASSDLKLLNALNPSAKHLLRAIPQKTCNLFLDVYIPDTQLQCIPAVKRVMRAGVGKDIELRHQRNPDVIFDCIRSTSGASPMAASILCMSRNSEFSTWESVLECV